MFTSKLTILHLLCESTRYKCTISFLAFEPYEKIFTLDIIHKVCVL